MRRLLRPAGVGVVLTAIALTGRASAVGPPAARALQSGAQRGAQAAPAQPSGGSGQDDQSRESGRGGAAAQDGQPAQQNPPDGQNQAPVPVFRSGVDFVRVDVIVSDKNGNA